MNILEVYKSKKINSNYYFEENQTVSNKVFIMPMKTGDIQTFINDEESMKHRYTDQSGYISCTEGYIYKISISDSISECSNELSTLLATLCMIDPELNSLSDKNYSFNKLEADDLMEFMLNHCRKLIGVTIWLFKQFVSINIWQNPIGKHDYLSP